MIKIFIADDHQLVIDGLAGMIERQEDMQLLGYANDGQEAVMKVKVLKPDIVLLDLDMPKMNGMVAAEEILKDGLPTKIIILSMHGEKGISQKLINMGVSGYLVKNADQQELLTGIRWITNGKNYFSPELTKKLAATKTALPFENGVSARDTTILSTLSDREKEIISFISEGMTSSEIGEKLFISSRTVETHRKNLMKKLEVNNVAGIIRFALKNGLST